MSSFRYDELTEILHPRLQALNLFFFLSSFLLTPDGVITEELRIFRNYGRISDFGAISVTEEFRRLRPDRKITVIRNSQPST